MWNEKPSFTFEIDNFWEKEGGIPSHVFVADGCEWFLNIWPKGHRLIGDHLAAYLYVANQQSLGTGWKRTASYYFTLNQSDKELCRSSVIESKVFDAESLSLGFGKLFPRSKLKEKFFMGKDSVIIEVYINVIEAVDGESEDVTEKETVDINGFQVSASQIALVRKIFAEQPDIALGFKPKNQVVRTAYMNVLLDLINTLNKPSKSHSETELIISQGELRELEEVGFEIDWLKLKFDNVFLERKKDDDYGSRVQQLEERVKNLEQMEEKVESLKRKVDEVLLVREKAKAVEPWLKKLDEYVKNFVFTAEKPAWGIEKTFPLSQLEEKCFIEKNSLIIEVYINVASVRKIFAEQPDIALGFKPKNQVVKTAYMNVLLGVINRLNKPLQSHSESELITTHGELSELEEVGFKIDWLKSKLENIFLERKKDGSDGSRVQQLEERVKKLEQKKIKMASLKRKVDEVLLERKKAKADEPRVENLEERVKNLEVMESSFKMDCLKSKLENVSLDKKKADDADGSRVQQLEESVKNLETMVSDLKAKLDEGKAKSSSDEFLLV
ncbi:unnamed protein product [Eruca vesicaria subsp. sativa]|uniref:MATH domain-containing protein n=1 Tax=Eruca vesicaria subsp. sativa TaxID=29727 RepID=A0ABC8M254_ERUVS|nr:unnamed protein product [Eruca vesicaria subsp. sativa]